MESIHVESSVERAFLSALPERTPQPFRAFIGSALGLPLVDRLYGAARATSRPYFSTAALDALGVRIIVEKEDLERIPADGPVIVAANHPFGLLDGMMLDSVLRQVRPDSRVMVNSILSQIPELRDGYVWVDVLSSHDAAIRNSRSLRGGIEWVTGGGLLAMFPAGEVAHWDFRKARISDPKWNTAIARLATRTGARVVPAFFDGANSLAFQLAACIHPMLRTASLPRELVNKRGGEFRLRFGAPIAAEHLTQYRDPVKATEYVRARTYLLEHRRAEMRTSAESTTPPRRDSVADPADAAVVKNEIGYLDACGAKLLDQREFSVYLASGSAIDALRHEIGRLRESTFRQVGEGTGKPLDLDEFDSYYHHLILWDKANNSVAGAYRLAWTADVLPQRGVEGLYTSRLFRYQREFFERIGPAVELGRSFIVPERQREFAPLLLLWQGIGRAVALRPECPVLFGAVSISGDYCTASRELLVRFLSRKQRRDLSSLISPRRPMRLRLSRHEEIEIVAGMLDDIDGLSEPIRDLEAGSGVPVLIRQYLKLGGEIVSFNVDREFSDVVDALLVVDLRKTGPKALAKYMGADAMKRFLAHHSLEG
jgi:putative hemolysin